MKKALSLLIIALFLTSPCFAEDISKEKALDIAEQICKENGWGWERTDVRVTDKGDNWSIYTYPSREGSNAYIRIEKKTGKILQKGFIPY